MTLDPSALPTQDYCKILICVGPRCDAEGKGRALFEEVRAALAKDFPDAARAGRLSCDSRDCLRHCTREPIVRLEPSGEVLSNPEAGALLRLSAQMLSDES
ncbi:(2Fe-2S) ferredoxin domain-containing protein [Methylocystis heyeri]|uniref:(2Fe-2S) ferredoxin domain-containing protein n=1 Tax=Methylocystis heyeri TaxID=391905 RepID=A0A6B8KDD3_9HYPH|nr:(2Fe-2S) ferredoxin domain-containing protein [Methylocystis heyeri]QGM46444.1 (2Fe-2S) ferredoxin domain-containing protein [Methylocystis heyeri]